MGLHLFFSFELSYQLASRSPVWQSLRGRWSGKTRNLLQSLPWLCRMVVRGLAGPPHHPNRSGRNWPYTSATRTLAGNGVRGDRTSKWAKGTEADFSARNVKFDQFPSGRVIRPKDALRGRRTHSTETDCTGYQGMPAACRSGGLRPAGIPAVAWRFESVCRPITLELALWAGSCSCLWLSRHSRRAARSRELWLMQ